MKIKNEKGSVISRIFKDNKYCWLAFGCSAVIMLIVYICYSLIPFGDVTILRMDLYHQYGPLFAEFYDRSSTRGIRVSEAASWATSITICAARFR